MNKHQTNALNVIKQKLNSEDLQVDNMEVIYNFLTYKNKKEWNLRNCYLSGFGECLKSNNDLTKEEIERFKDFWSSFNVVIIKNKTTNEYNCLLLPPAVEYDGPVNQNMVQHPLAPLDTIEQNKKSDNWIVSNEFDDQIEIAPYTFDKDYEMIEILPDNLLSFNDLLCEYLSKDEYPLFSTVLYDVYNIKTKDKIDENSKQYSKK